MQSSLWPCEERVRDAPIDSSIHSLCVRNVAVVNSSCCAVSGAVTVVDQVSMNAGLRASAQFRPFSSSKQNSRCAGVASTSGRGSCLPLHFSRARVITPEGLQLMGWPSSKQSQRCWRIVAAATDYGEAYDNLFRSKVGILLQLLHSGEFSVWSHMSRVTLHLHSLCACMGACDGRAVAMVSEACR